MKNFRILFITVIGIILFGISSCETEEVQPTTNAARQNQQADLAVDKPFFKKYYLSATDFFEYEYDTNLRIKKMVAGPYAYQEYNFTQQNGSPYLIVNHFNNGYLCRRVKYLLNSQGLCQTSTTKSYNSIGEATSYHTTNYDYYPNGKLKAFYNSANPLDKVAFTYDATGDLVKLAFHDATGTEYAKQEYNYIDPATNTKKLDLYQFNADVLNINFIPKIFGVFANHLPMSYKRTSLHYPEKNYIYQYQFNADGYPVKRKIINMGDHSLKASQDFHYLIRDFGAK